MKNMCGIKKYFALSGLVITIHILSQDFDSLRPELLHCGALPLLFRSNYLKILKGLKVKAQGGVKRNPEIKHEAEIRAESPICFIDAEFVIQNQEQHHKKISFKDELRKFFKEYNIDFDEKYVWD